MVGTHGLILRLGGRSGLLLPQVATDFPAPKGKSADAGKMTVAQLTDDSFLGAYTVDELTGVKSYLDAYIPKRLEAQKGTDIATALALLKSHGITTAKDVLAVVAPEKAGGKSAK